VFVVRKTRVCVRCVAQCSVSECVGVVFGCVWGVLGLILSCVFDSYVVSCSVFGHGDAIYRDDSL